LVGLVNREIAVAVAADAHFTAPIVLPDGEIHVTAVVMHVAFVLVGQEDLALGREVLWKRFGEPAIALREDVHVVGLAGARICWRSVALSGVASGVVEGFGIEFVEQTLGVFLRGEEI